MSRVLLGLIAALAIAAALLWWRMDAATTRAAALDAALNMAVTANQAGQATITALAAEMLANNREAVEALRRERSARARERAAAAELERLKRDNQNLRAYLDSGIPSPVADWLWLDVQAGGGNGGPGGAGVSTEHPDGADAGAEQPLVTHQAGWTWAMLTDIALESCNADKAAMRAWTRLQAPQD